MPVACLQPREITFDRMPGGNDIPYLDRRARDYSPPASTTVALGAHFSAATC